MAANILGKVLNVIGIENEVAEDERDYTDYNTQEEGDNMAWNSRNSDERDYENSYRDDYGYSSRERDYEDSSAYRYESKVVQHPAASPRHRMMIYQLTNYEDARDIIDDLLDDHSVLINLESLDLDDAQRIIDTLIGACYAINATIKKAAQQTYLLAPSSVEIAGTYADER